MQRCSPRRNPLQIVDDVELEAPRAGEVRVRIVACGVCHSDVSLVSGTFPSMGPTIVGHEAAGVVVELGHGVSSLALGDHVVLTPNPACGQCAYCRKGLHSVCPDSMSIATSMLPDGTTRLSRGGEMVYRGLGLAAWADEVVVAEQGAIRIDSDVPLDVACVIGCAVQTGVGAAINTVSIEPGDSVLVLGAGGIGVSIVQGAAISGASHDHRVGPSESRREQALRFGATHVLDPADTDVVAATMELTGIGADVAFEAVGSAALIKTGIEAVRNGGTTVMVGAAPVDDQVAVTGDHDVHREAPGRVAARLVLGTARHPAAGRAVASGTTGPGVHGDLTSPTGGGQRGDRRSRGRPRSAHRADDRG